MVVFGLFGWLVCGWGITVLVIVIVVVLCGFLCCCCCLCVVVVVFCFVVVVVVVWGGGAETSVFFYRHSWLGQHLCGHHQGVGVDCQPGVLGRGGGEGTSHQANAEHWFPTSYLQPLPELITSQVSENC